MRQFYMDVLGFLLHSELSMETEVVEPEGEPTICFLKICDADTPLGRDRHPPMLVLIDHRRHVFAKQRFRGHDVSQSTLNHLAFEVPADSFTFHVERLESFAIPTRHTEFPAFGAQAMFFNDPEGNTLEFICHAATSNES